MTDDRNVRNLSRRAVGALTGAIIVFGLMQSGIMQTVASWPADEIASTILAGLLFIPAFVTGPAAMSGRGFRMLTEAGHDEPVESNALSILRRQAMVTGLLALLLLVPPVARQLGYTGAAAILPVAILVGLMLTLGWLHMSLQRDTDELSRAVSVESSAISFTVSGLMLFGWAALEKLGVVPAVSAWTLVTAMTVVSLVIATVVSVKKGAVGAG